MRLGPASARGLVVGDQVTDRAILRHVTEDGGVDLAVVPGSRIIIHGRNGPVAGVIGRKKFTYDLWGAAVNLASRMQSSGLPGHIHVPAEFRDRLADRFSFIERGTVHCKGVGEVQTYLLESRRH